MHFHVHPTCLISLQHFLFSQVYELIQVKSCNIVVRNKEKWLLRWWIFLFRLTTELPKSEKLNKHLDFAWRWISLKSFQNSALNNSLTWKTSFYRISTSFNLFVNFFEAFPNVSIRMDTQVLLLYWIISLVFLKRSKYFLAFHSLTISLTLWIKTEIPTTVIINNTNRVIKFTSQ